MSNRLFQSIIHQLKDAVDRVIGVIDETGTIIACSELGRIGEVLDTSVGEQVFSGSDVVCVNGWRCLRCFYVYLEQYGFGTGSTDFGGRCSLCTGVPDV